MKRVLLLLMSACLLFACGCEEKSSRISEIEKRGELFVGVKSDVPNFGFLDPSTGNYEGFEIEIARNFAKTILGDETAITFIPVTALTRDKLLQNREIDFIIATFTITEERKKTYNFSQPYYEDEIGFLVKKGSEIKELSDINGKVAGAIFASTAFDALDNGKIIVRTSFEKKGFASYPELKNALLTDEIDVFVSDKSILSGYLDDETVLLDEGFEPQSYGIATRLDDKAFAKFIDDHLSKMKADGSFQEILSHWSIEG